MRNGFQQRRESCASLILGALVLSACGTTGGSPGAPAPALAGTQWVVVEIDGRRPIGEALTASFSVDGRVNGNSGCNTFAGPYIQTGSTVRFGELLSTRRACVNEDRQRQETRVLAILGGETRIGRDGSDLTVRGGNGALLLTPER